MALRLKHLSCRFFARDKHAPAIEYTLDLANQTSVGLIGSNGAGKSSFLNLLAGRFDDILGACQLDDIDMNSKPNEYKSRIGYCPDVLPYQHNWRVLDFLTLCCRLKQASVTRADIEALLNSFDLLELQEKSISRLSLGQRQRVNFAQAAINQPALLLFDEPLNGLDSEQQSAYWRWFERQHAIIIVASHNISELVERCQTLLIIDQHRIVANIDCNLDTDLLVLQSASETTNTLHPKLISTTKEQHYSGENVAFRGRIREVLPILFNQAKAGQWQW